VTGEHTVLGLVARRALEAGAPALIEVQVPRASETDPWRFLRLQSPTDA
jgi:hypothetical protein